MSSTNEKEGVKNVLVAVDGSENSERAVRVASFLAKNTGAELTVVYVVCFPSSLYSAQAPVQLNKIEGEARRDAEKVVASASLVANKEGVQARTEIIEHMDSVVRGITEYAEKSGTDLIVVGTRGLSGFKRLVLGSVASGLVHYAHCSVLVVR